MEEHGIPRDGGPIGMMLMEHEEGRSLRKVDVGGDRSRGNEETKRPRIPFSNRARSYLRL